MTIKTRLESFYQAIVGIQVIDFVTKSTLLILILPTNLGSSRWEIVTALQIFAVAGVLIPTFNRSRILWLSISLAMLYRCYMFWWIQENHYFVFTLWCIAISISFYFEDTEKLLRRNSRILIGLMFFAAVLWKGVLSPDFMNGSYFHYTFLTGGRFHEESIICGNLSDEDILHNRRSLKSLLSSKAPNHSIQLKSTPLLAFSTKLITWWTILLEGAIAIAFLVSRKTFLGRIGNICLLVFCWTTYLVAPVFSFALLLLTLAMAQTESHEKQMRFAIFLSLMLQYVFLNVPITETISLPIRDFYAWLGL